MTHSTGKRIFLLCTLALLACVSMSQAARAAVVIALELSELVERSEYIVVANAQQATSRYDDHVIVTDVALKVVTSLKGPAKPGSSITVTHLGGEVGDIALRVPGAARFTLGQSAIVFLRRAAAAAAAAAAATSGELNVTGMSQGVLPIIGTGKAAEVETAGAGATLMRRDENGALVNMPSRPAQKRVLSELLTEIDQLVHKR
ncbi:MAG: hypothetical protein RL701_316 [Pseudomonadota bacterium]